MHPYKHMELILLAREKRFPAKMKTQRHKKTRALDVESCLNYIGTAFNGSGSVLGQSPNCAGRLGCNRYLSWFIAQIVKKLGMTNSKAS